MPNSDPQSSQLFTQEQSDSLWQTVEKRMSSASVFVESPEGKLLIVKAHYKPHWSLPGGIVDKGESPRTAAVREVYEEVGIHLDPTALQFMMVIDRRSDARGHTYQFIFRSVVSQQQIDRIKLEASEIVSSELISREDVLREPRDGSGRIFEKSLYHWATRTAGYAEQDLEVTTI